MGDADTAPGDSQICKNQNKSIADAQRKLDAASNARLRFKTES